MHSLVRNYEGRGAVASRRQNAADLAVFSGRRPSVSGPLAVAGRPLKVAILIALVVAGALAAAPAFAQDKPLDLSQDKPLGDLDSETAQPLQISGFAVAGYDYEGRSKENTFAGSKLAVSLFRELSENFWIFGQLTTLLELPEEESGEEVVTEIEIDNLIINFTPPGVPELSFFVGKFDNPLGFERDDEPLNLQPTTTFNFELARPLKMVGVGARWNATPKFNVLALVTNGWDSQIDPNHGKSVGGRLGFLPTENSSIGLGGLYGPEGEQGETNNRYLLSLDYAFQPTPDWILGGEANLGGDSGVNEDGSDATWSGATLTIFRRLARRFGVTARGEVFDDQDGARTGVEQTVESFSLAPVYFIGTGRNGIFANVEHTTFRIPRFQIRGEVRLNHSDVDFFETSGAPGDWNVEYRLQLVATF